MKFPSEYQQVAALLNLEIDLLAEVATSDSSKEDLLEDIKYLNEKREKIINDPVFRENQYAINQMLFNLTVKK